MLSTPWPTTDLSSAELARNVRFGNEYLFEYDEKNHDVVTPIYMPTMPNVVDAHSRVSHFVVATNTG